MLLEQHTAASSATLDFTTFISGSYDEYVFEFVNIQPATDNADFLMEAGTGGGPTYDTGANYEWELWAVNQAGGTAALGLLGDTAVHIANSIGNAGTISLVGRLTLYNPQSATLYKNATVAVHYGQFTGNYSAWSGGCTYLSATAVTAIRFLMSTGNIAAGTIRVYGLAK